MYCIKKDTSIKRKNTIAIKYIHTLIIFIDAFDLFAYQSRQKKFGQLNQSISISFKLSDNEKRKNVVVSIIALHRRFNYIDILLRYMDDVANSESGVVVVGLRGYGLASYF